MHNHHLYLRNEKIRLVVLCCSLLAMALVLLLFFCTGNIFPVFLTMVLTFLGYKYLDGCLSAQITHN